jgi:hypothetical protein
MNGRLQVINWFHAILRPMLTAVIVFCALSRTAEAQYEGKPAFEVPGANGVDSAVRALTVFDDGTGPALYVGGSFTRAGDVAVNGIAKWDGSTWTPLGTGINGPVYALTVFDDGTSPALYAGGSFTRAGDVAVNNVAKWNGSTWTPLDTNAPSTTLALTVFDDGTGPALYAGASFDGVAKWDGLTWTPLGTGLSNLYALTGFDDGTGPALYAAGLFLIRKWDGANWTALGGLSGIIVGALAVFDDGSGPALFAGGNFQRAGNTVADSFAKWDGSSWTGLHGISEDIYVLSVFDDGTGPALYLGGGYHGVPGRVRKMNGEVLNPGFTIDVGYSGLVYALAGFDDGTGPAVYAGGYFNRSGATTVNNIAKWNGSNWVPLGDRCNYSLSQNVDSIDPAGGTGTPVAVTANPGCTWSVATDVGWITNITGGGTGSGTVTFTVAQNITGAPRVGTLTIAGLPVTVFQDPDNSGCTYLVDNISGTNFPPEGGTLTFTVTPGPRCTWHMFESDELSFDGAINLSPSFPELIHTQSEAVSALVNPNPMTEDLTARIKIGPYLSVAVDPSDQFISVTVHHR